METIYKYKLEIKNIQDVRVPFGAIPIHVGEQDGELYVWCRVESENSPEPIKFYIHGTGQDTSERDFMYYLGTVKMPDGLVWHIFN